MAKNMFLLGMELLTNQFRTPPKSSLSVHRSGHESEWDGDSLRQVTSCRPIFALIRTGLAMNVNALVASSDALLLVERVWYGLAVECYNATPLRQSLTSSLAWLC